MKTDRIARVNEILRRELATQLYRLVREEGFDPGLLQKLGRMLKGEEAHNWFWQPLLNLPEKDGALGDSYLEQAQVHGIDTTAKLKDRYR